jgi:hypothetical protein
MRLTIVAGLIMGVSLAVHSALGAHAKAKVDHPARAVRAPVREVVPWYIAGNDCPRDGRIPRTLILRL